MEYNLWQKFINSNYGKRTTLPIQYLFGDRDKAEQFWEEDMGRFGDLLLSTTKPFRTGANILAQNWGSALTGKDMSQEENQGKFLKWLAGGLTDEEQQVINDKPYLSALKSGAGMASTLAPFGTQGLRAAQFASNPLTNRLAQLSSQGALEGSLGGFGYSREGKEVQDTLTGAALGAGGELLMDYLTNPQFRKMITEAGSYVDPSTGSRMYRGALGNDDDILFSNDLSKVPETPKDLGADIENLAEFTDSNNPDSGMDLRNIDLKDTKYPPVDIPDDLQITNYQDYDNPIKNLELEAKNYATPEEFVKTHNKLYRGQSEKTLNFAPDRELLTPDYKGVAFSRDLDMAKPYGENVLERYIDEKRVLHAKDLPKETLNKLRSDWKKLGLEPEFYQQESLVNEAIKIAKSKGYDAVDLADIYPLIGPEAEVRVLRPSVIREMEQLIDIWKKAHPNELGKSLRGGFKEIIEKASKDGIK